MSSNRALILPLEQETCREEGDYESLKPGHPGWKTGPLWEMPPEPMNEWEK